MAGPTSILNPNALTQEAWPKTFFEFMLQNMLFSDMMGPPGSDMPIIIDRTLVGRPGDTITFELDQPLSDAGQGDDGTLEGNEEVMSFWNMPMTLHERANAVRSAGLMTDKRAAINILTKGFYALNRWGADQVENDLVYAMCGIGNQGTYAGEGSSDIETVNEVAPSTNRVLYGGQTVARVYTAVADDGEIGAGGADDWKNYLFGTKVIEKMRVAAQLATPKIQPILINGRYYYVVVMHPLQRKALRAETGEQGWSHIVATAQQRGMGNWTFGKQGSGRERMFNGIIGIYDDVILYESERLPTRVAGEVLDSADLINAFIVNGTCRVCRSVLLGAKAVCFAWGKDWTRRTKNFDYGRKPGVGTDAIYAVRKTQFRNPGAGQNANTPGDDFGVIVHDTAAEEA